MVALSIAAGAAGCSKARDDRSPAPGAEEPCEPNDIYGPPPCRSDDDCVRDGEPGWYCDPEVRTYDDGCGNEIEWGRVCRCCREVEAEDEADAGGETESGVDAADFDPLAEDVLAGTETEAAADDGVAQDAAEERDETVALRRDARAESGPPPDRISVMYGPPATLQSPADGLRQALGRTRTSMRTCYQRALAETPDLGGRLVLRATLAPGRQREVTVELTEDDPRLREAGCSECVLRAARRLRYTGPPVESEPIEITVPLVFAPPSDAPDEP